MRQYITTAIDFPNGDPHMGHAMEKVLADVCARWFRLRGDEARFQIGTDDHGIKMQRTAEKQGLKPEELIAQNIPKFQDLFDQLNISYDFFVSTSVTPGHYDTVQALWNKLLENGHLEKRTYTGLYCSGCEQFMTQRDLVDGLCPNHQTPPEEVSEENWFFLLKDKQDLLKEMLDPESGSYTIVPDYRGNEVRGILNEGLEDVSFSRPRSTLYWGVPVPNDEDQVMYVWCDNLTNYMSTHGYLTDKEDPTWWDEAEVTHVIGKDIARFHALNWPAMLHSAGVKTPDRLLIHGFITSQGKKMGKSVGNVVVPAEILDHFGGNPDPLRFYLSHEVPVGRDGDFSWERIENLYDSALRNDIGNLLNRVLVLLNKADAELSHSDDSFVISDLWKKYEANMNEFKLENGIACATELARQCNQYIDETKPWEKDGDEKIQLLTQLAEALRHVALLLLPFVPDTAYRISKQLNVPYADQMLEKSFVITDQLRSWGGLSDWKSVGEPEILFKPLEEDNS